MENLLEVKLEQKWIFDSIRLKVSDVWNTWYFKIIEWDWIGYKKIIQGVDGVLHASICKIVSYIVQMPNSIIIVLFFKILPKPLKEKLSFIKI